MRRKEAIGWIAAATAGVIGAAAVYTPWINAGFDLEDFSEFVTLLQEGGSGGEQFTRLVAYYAAHGRFNVAVYGSLLVKWHLLGAEPIAWQWFRVVEMVLLGCLFAAVLRSFRMSRPASALAASLLLVSSAGASSFQRMTLSEPFAVCVLLIGTLVAVRYQKMRYWRSAGVLLGVMCVLLIAAKEILVVGIAPVAIIAAVWRGGGIGRPTWSERERWLLAAIAIAVAVGALPVITVAMRAADSAYSSDYTFARSSLGRIGQIAVLAALPVREVMPRPGTLVAYPANVLVLVMSLAAVTSMWRCRSWQVGAAVILLYTLPAVMAGVVYSPWPRFESFYALPFCLGTMAVFGIAIDAAAWHGKPARAIAVAMAIGAITFACIGARATTASRMARRSLMSKVAHLVAGQPQGRLVVFESLDGWTSWQGTAATVGRAAGSFRGQRHPVSVIAAKCGEGRRLAGPVDALVISVSSCANSWGPGTWVLAERYRVVDWTNGRMLVDSAYIALVGAKRAKATATSKVSPVVGSAVL